MSEKRSAGTALACEVAEGGRDGRAGCPIRVRDPVSTLALRMAVQQQSATRWTDESFLRLGE
jgi:hypothetical protein